MFKQRRFEQLALDQRSADPQHRLLRKHHRPLRHRVDVAPQLHSAQVFEEFAFQERFARPVAHAAQIVEVGLVEREIFEVFDDVGQPAGDRVSPVERILAEGDVEYRIPVRHPGLPVAVRHRNFVEVRKQRQRIAVYPFQGIHEFSRLPIGSSIVF